MTSVAAGTGSASVEETLKQINSVLKGSGGPYSTYSCKTVSWDDVQRGSVGGNLSCWGSNITDTRLYAKDGRRLFTVRGDNWNERLGQVTADDLALIASDVSNGGGSSGLRPVTLRSVLSNIFKYGGYSGLEVDSLADDKLDEKVSVRFQTTFLPVEAGDKQTLEFAPEAYNYNTMDDSDPRNLILLCTTQGLAIQQDGKGAKKLFHHHTSDGGLNIHRYWLEAESSSHKVGGSQVESTEEKKDALERGKATSVVIGTKAIGTRFNVLMTIQVPLNQKQPERMDSWDECDDDDFYYDECDEDEEDDGDEPMGGFQPGKMYLATTACRKSAPCPRRPVVGKSSAARVSRGSFYDTWDGLTATEPERHPNEHITATIVMYYTCSGGVPSAADVMSAVDDLEGLYKAIEVNGKLADSSFDFMKSELTVKDMNDIQQKVQTQPPPPQPKPDVPSDFDVFPN